ncbi:SRPBCC family protein [Jejudonia soesokkakensis]|uniref:SRPBCC family protein n=1 Tax=Jejudonia soesokkakensis TaxID=1323432 RepID=A0ABW2MSW9_9FLAO
MRYSIDIRIDLPKNEVIKKLDNPENMKHWQKGLVDYKFLSGTPGENGATMELQYKMGKRDMILIETIIKNNFPDEFHASYDAKGVHTIQKNFFEEIDASHTKWISESEFKFNSFMMKIIGFLMPRAFKKQSKQYLLDFKNFAENNISVYHKE